MRMRESAIPEIFLLALKNDKEKNAQDYNEKVLKMNNEKIQNFRISFLTPHWVFRLIADPLPRNGLIVLMVLKKMVITPLLLPVSKRQLAYYSFYTPSTQDVSS